MENYTDKWILLTHKTENPQSNDGQNSTYLTHKTEVSEISNSEVYATHKTESYKR